MGARLTASRLPLARHCVFFARPDVEIPPEPRRRSSGIGSAFHALISGEIDSLADAADRYELTPDETETARRLVDVWRADPVSSHPWRHEIAFAIDVETGVGRELADSDGHRDYSTVTDTEIAGTADLVMRSGGVAVVADTKTGMADRVEDVRENRQLRALALMTARAWGVDEAVIVVLHVTEDGVHETRHRLDVFDLDDIEAEIRAAHRDIADAQPYPGEHCARLWCPARAVCPATMQALAQVAPDAPTRLSIRESLEHRETAHIALDALRVIEAAVEDYRREVREAADRHDGIPLPSGRVWRRCETSRTSINLDANGGEALAILRDAGAGSAVTPSTSQKAIERALRDTHGLAGRELRERMSDLMSQLAAVGVLRIRSVESYQERAK